MGKNDAELLVLSAAILGFEADSAFAQRFGEVLDAMPAAQQRDFARARALFSSRAGGIVTLTSPRPFLRLSPEARHERLAAFAQSKLTLFRTIYLGLQRVIISAYYADPAIQAALGYIPPVVNR